MWVGLTWLACKVQKGLLCGERLGWGLCPGGAQRRVSIGCVCLLLVASLRASHLLPSSESSRISSSIHPSFPSPQSPPPSP